MSDLLRAFLSDNLKPVPVRGLVDGVTNMLLEPKEEGDSTDESDTEQKEYVKRELNSYFTESRRTGGLMDILDDDNESMLGSEFLQSVNLPPAFSKYNFNTHHKKDLPIDHFKQRVLDIIQTNSVLIIHGPTGCGKTTQVPQFILNDCKARNVPCNIVVTQPRRIAAINIAQRVCEERGWAVGTVCGYQVGLNKNAGEDVILTYVTTEVLLQKLILQKNLNKYSHVIIDEVHERNKSLDFLLLIARKFLFTNSPNVKLILMSATMESEQFAYYFRSIPRSNAARSLLAPILHVDKQSQYTTNLYYTDHCANLASTTDTYEVNEPRITPQMYNLCLTLIKLFHKFDEVDTGTGVKIAGSVLVFLPGFHEIEEMHKLLSEHDPDNDKWEIIPLHSSLSTDHLARAFEKPKPKLRKIILSTNIAESSVTVPDVNYVIDFCLTKLMTVNHLTKFSSLALEWASHNNCTQRAGRVGRVANGRVYRLVPRDFYEYHMQPNSIPELQRAPLENVVLYMKLLELHDTPKNVLSLALSPPDLKDIETCIWHLKELGALLQTCRGVRTAADGDLTFIGRVMGNLPIDVHLGKMIILGHIFSCLEETIIMAAGCSTRNLFITTFHERLQCYKKKLLWADGSCSDFIALLNLYNVWLAHKRDLAFRSLSEEYAWCRTNFVNLKGLREWDILIKEIKKRLENFRIEPATGPERIYLSPLEKPIVLKVIICGAFYPNYFIRSSDFGQVDAREAVRTLSGRDPFNTVYFTNMKSNQPGQIYVRQIKKLLKADNNVCIGFDSNSSKIFVEFKKARQPETVRVHGSQYITTIPGSISMDVFEAVRKRQLRILFSLKVLTDEKAWEFANKTKEKVEKEKSILETTNCYSTIDYNPLPALDLQYMPLTITHYVDAGHFYCQNCNTETSEILSTIYRELNTKPLTPFEGKVKVNDKIYVAMYTADGNYYRCKVLGVLPGPVPRVQIIFIDYGNTQTVPANKLYQLPNSKECSVAPLAICCVLSEVQPCLVLNPKALWTEEVNNLFMKKTQGLCLYGKVYSVVEDVVHLEIFQQGPGNRGSMSFNQWLINNNYGQKCQESFLSKMDHEKRLQVLAAEDPTQIVNYHSNNLMQRYTDFDSPDMEGIVETVDLKGPFSPLEMKIAGVVQATAGVNVKVDEDSVNAVLLDDKPDDPHSRMLVAGSIGQSSSGSTLRISQTTMMPSIPGFPVMMMLLFCPTMEPKTTADGTKVAAILCGLGFKEGTNRANFPMHDIPYVLDTVLEEALIIKINGLRFVINDAIKTMSNISDELSFPNELVSSQMFLKQKLFELLRVRHEPTDKVSVKHLDEWNMPLCEDIEFMKMNTEIDDQHIWPMLWFVKVAKDKYANVSINKNLEELMQIAKRLIPEKEIVCELCSSELLSTVSEVRIHLFKEVHKKKFSVHKSQSEKN